MDFFAPGPWRGFDPFEYLKTAESRDPALEPDLAGLDNLQRLDANGLGRAKLLASLWGNRSDLGFRFGKSGGLAEPAATGIGQATVTILKGDLNYRRLVGDRDWPPTTPFSDVASYFPSSVAALRTLKSDVITGLDQGTVAKLDNRAALAHRWQPPAHPGRAAIATCLRSHRRH